MLTYLLYLFSFIESCSTQRTRTYAGKCPTVIKRNQLYFCFLMFFTLAAVASQTETECQPEWWDLTSSIALQHFAHKAEGSKKKLRKQNLQRNNKRKLQFLICPNNLNSLLFVFLMVTQTLVDTVFSKGKNP